MVLDCGTLVDAGYLGECGNLGNAAGHEHIWDYQSHGQCAVAAQVDDLHDQDPDVGQIYDCHSLGQVVGQVGGQHTLAYHDQHTSDQDESQLSVNRK